MGRGYNDECGVCNGPGAVYECGCTDIPDGDCDCDGNQLDALGVCGGECVADVDSDGICDDVDDCVGEYDECGVCNGPGAIYPCGCSEIPEGFCDCDGSVLDAVGVCGGVCEYDFNSNDICDDQEIYGCTYIDATNYNHEATADDGSCIYESGETGCTYSEAINYNSNAQIDDGSCEFEEQQVSCQSDLNGNGSIGSEDLLLFLADYDTLCE